MSPEELARHGDPDTSREAAEGLTSDERTERQRWVYRALRDFGPCTDEALAVHYGSAVARGMVGPQTDSSLRTRRHELVELGWVRALEEKGKTATGRPAKVWSALEAQERNDAQQAAAEDRRAEDALTAEEPSALVEEPAPPSGPRSAIFGWED